MGKGIEQGISGNERTNGKRTVGKSHRVIDLLRTGEGSKDGKVEAIDLVGELQLIAEQGKVGRGRKTLTKSRPNWSTY